MASKRSRSSTRQKNATATSRASPLDDGASITLESTDTWLTGAEEPKVMQQEREKYPNVVELVLAFCMFLLSGTMLSIFIVFAIFDGIVFLVIPFLCYAISMSTIAGSNFDFQDVFLDTARNGSSAFLKPFWESAVGSSARLTMAYLLFCYAFFVWHVKYRGNRSMKVLYSLLFSGWSLSCHSFSTAAATQTEKIFLMVSSTSGVVVAIGYFFEPQLTKTYVPKAVCAPAV